MVSEKQNDDFFIMRNKSNIVTSYELASHRKLNKNIPFEMRTQLFDDHDVEKCKVRVDERTTLQNCLFGVCI